MSYSLTELTGAVAGEPHLISNPEIHAIFFDSRQLIPHDKALFFALKGSHRDGHSFIEELFAKGLQNFVVSTIPENLKGKANFILVDDVSKSLQSIAHWHRGKFELQVVGITGSNGKTIVKEWLYQILRDDFYTVRTIRSYNSQIGVPLSVWQIGIDHTLGIFEAGISTTGEMENLEKIIQPDIGIITNIGDAHNGGFENEKEKTLEKLKLFGKSERVIFPYDNDLIREELASNGKGLSWSFTNGDADVFVKSQVDSETGSCLTCIWSGAEFLVEIPFKDKASKENAISCFATLIALEKNPRDYFSKFSALHPVALRMEMIRGINNCQLINDSYNSDLASLQIALDFLASQATSEQRSVILSDLEQQKLSSDDLYKAVAEMLTTHNVHVIITVGAQSEILGKFLPITVKHAHFTTTQNLLEHPDALGFTNGMILLKGARSYKFERIAEVLSEKVHETALQINLNHVTENFLTFRNHLPKATKLMVVLKASAYGSGMVEIARLLSRMGVDQLAVAFADEGVTLRQAGLDLPILVFHASPESFTTCIQYNLIPEVYSNDQLSALLKTLKLRGVKNFPVHCNLNTGMNRLGFNSIDDLIDGLDAAKGWIAVEGLMTHLAASDDLDHDEFTIKQLEKFKTASKRIESHLGHQTIKHALNTSGIIRFESGIMDMVRLGLGLYGYGEGIAGLSPVGRLVTRLTQITSVKSGESIGYGRSYTAKEDMTIGTIGIGYADGYDRRLSNGVGEVEINGLRAPIVGRVCMDMCMIDLTSMPETRVGDEVVLLGDGIGLYEMAQWLGTIPYEVLTSISSRVKRVFETES